MKKIVDQHVENIKTKYVATQTPLDIVAEIQSIAIHIILNCSFGHDVSQILIEYEDHGVKTMAPLNKILNESFHRCLMRKFNLNIILFPDSYKWHLNATDRENLRNIKRIRAFCLDLVKKRRLELQDPNYVDVGGLMSTLIQMDLFSGNDDMIVDECFTFFFAGS
jgi:cytochrome P450